MNDTRRKLLLALGVSGLAFTGAVGRAQTALQASPLGGGLTLLQGAGSNVVVAEGPDAVVIVDGGHPDHAEALLAQVRQLTGNKPVSALFNTNWREERGGLNHLLGPAGTPIIAHENTRLWQNADFYSNWQDRQFLPWPKQAQANRTFYTSGELTLGEETLEYGHISQCSSDGDIYVRFRKANVLVVGDMLGSDSYVVLDYSTGGWISGAQKTTARLLELADADTRVIAASGGVLARSHLQEQAELLTAAYDAVAKAFQTGRSLAEFKAADPLRDFRARWGDPDLFLTLLYRGISYHVPGRAVRNII
ncbi:MAG: Beta-lactamase precursor [Pseudomonadota bacterium]|jgi:glyoxylase-like metal-dependent hydrolase (beta-lactamase superfamily II)